MTPGASQNGLERRSKWRRAWYWPASLLMLAAIVGVLIALPPADATNAAHGTVAKPPAATPTLNVVVVGDFFSYGYAASADRALRTSVPPKRRMEKYDRKKVKKIEIEE